MRIIPIRQENAESLSPLLPMEVATALKSGAPVTAFAAVEEDLAVGAISGVIDGESFELISVYVHPDYRRKGVGGAMLQRLFKLLEGERIPVRFEYSMQDLDDEDGATLSSFLHGQGFYEEDEKLPAWYIGQLGSLSIKDPHLNNDEVKILPFGEVPKEALIAASEAGRSKHAPVPEGGLISGGIDPRISSCVVVNGQVKAYIAAEGISDDFVRIPALYSEYHDPRAMMAMIARTAEVLNDSYKPNSRIAMLVANQVSEKLVRQLFKNPVNCTKRFIKV